MRLYILGSYCVGSVRQLWWNTQWVDYYYPQNQFLCVHPEYPLHIYWQKFRDTINARSVTYSNFPYLDVYKHIPSKNAQSYYDMPNQERPPYSQWINCEKEEGRERRGEIHQEKKRRSTTQLYRKRPQYGRYDHIIRFVIIMHMYIYMSCVCFS